MSSTLSPGEFGRAADVLHALADSSHNLSTAMRHALLLTEVEAEPDLSDWINRELSGYHDESVAIPAYRRHELRVVGNASNRAYRITSTPVPTAGLPDDLREYATAPHEFSESVEMLESLVASGEPEFNVSWDANAVAGLNGAIGKGGTAINDTYRFMEVWWEVPVMVVIGVLSRIRHSALTRIAAHIAPENRFMTTRDSLVDGLSGLHIAGSSNQIMIGSPGGQQALAIDPGDWASLESRLLAFGLGLGQLEDLRGIVDDPDTPEDTKTARAVKWARRAAADLGVSTAGSSIASLLLQYLGQV
jgi:hypothetical protein